MQERIETMRKILRKKADEKYKEFNRSLIPGETAPMIGVKLPYLREIAKNLAKSEWQEYLCALAGEEKQGTAYHEELLIHGILIGYVKCSVEDRMKLLEEFIPYINNWAVCDSSCMTYKFMRKDAKLWFTYLLKYISAENEYQVRFAVVSMLDHFVTAEFLERLLEVFCRIHHEGYYVKMAVAWAVSVCFVKFPAETKRFLQKNTLDDFTQNKAIQKIRESYRVSKEDKKELLQWKRK